MKRYGLLIILVLAILLSACAGQPDAVFTEDSTPVTTPQQVATAAPALQEGTVTNEYIAEAAQRISANPDEFRAFIAEYKEKNKAGMVEIDVFDLFNVGQILDIDVMAMDTQPTDGNRTLIYYQQYPVSGSSMQGSFGVFLDCMAQLPDANIPESLLLYDTLIKITATAQTAFTYQGGIPAIQWVIDVTCIDIEAGETTALESFQGTIPSSAVTFQGDRTYIDGTYPIQDAANYALSIAAGEMEMKASSRDIVDGEIWPQYGMFGEQVDGDVPTRSFPVSIEFAPKGTVCYAIQMVDPDSAPLCGYEWVHWMVVNLEETSLPENASIEMATDMIQGKNDFGEIGYGGPTPPDKPHTYVITVYALDSLVDLENGFSKEDFAQAIEGHVLAEAKFDGSYPNERN